MSPSEAVVDFVRAMEMEGVKPIEPIAQRLGSGELIRFRCEGDKPGRLNGWARLHLDDRPAGAFGNHRLGISRRWHGGSAAALTGERREALEREWREAKERRDRERLERERDAAARAGAMWRSCGPASANHPYVVSKQMDPAPLRQLGDLLLVPMYAADGYLWNLQRIWPDGTKRFMPGARVAGLFCMIGTFAPGSREVVIAEGYATADAIHQATGQPCVVSFSASNMAAVARLWKERRGDLDYIVFGDDDRATEAKTGRNPGREAAIAAAREIGAKLAFPRGRAA